MSPDRNTKRFFFTYGICMNSVLVLVGFAAHSLVPIYFILALDFLAAFIATIWIISGRIFR